MYQVRTGTEANTRFYVPIRSYSLTKKWWSLRGRKNLPQRKRSFIMPISAAGRGGGGWTDRPKITFHTHTHTPLLQASSCWCTSPGCLQENKQGGVNPKTVLAASPTMPWLPGCQQSTEAPLTSSSPSTKCSMQMRSCAENISSAQAPAEEQHLPCCLAWLSFLP